METFYVYVSHSRSITYKEELYPSIRSTDLFKECSVALPHENSDKPFNSKEFIPKCALMIAEVSDSAIGLGIELGWADMMNTPILCIYKKGSKISGSLHVITNNFIEYEDSNDLIQKLNDYYNTSFYV